MATPPAGSTKALSLGREASSSSIASSVALVLLPAHHKSFSTKGFGIIGVARVSSERKEEVLCVRKESLLP